MKPNITSWLKFFSAAGIPREEAENYAVTFSKNQIQLDMLPEIKKEYLKDMGITLMGHIIAILRHAKAVYADELKKTELSSSQKQTTSSVSKTKPVSASKDSKAVSKTDNESQQVSLKRKSAVVQMKSGDESKNKVRKKLCDSSDDVFAAAKSNVKLADAPTRNINNDVVPDDYKKGVFRRLGVEVLNPESSTANGTSESVFARLGDKSLPQASKEVTISVNPGPVKRLVASKVMNKPAGTKSIIRSRLDHKRQRVLVSPSYMDAIPEEREILVSPTYMDSTREERGIIVSPTYMDGGREERDILSRLNNNHIMERRNIKARLGKTSLESHSGSKLSGGVKKVSFGSVYQKLIPCEKKPAVRSGRINVDFGAQKGSIGLSTGVFSRLGKSFY
ncbi:uncharacterized protein C19orf47 homolog isoform X2 [Halyomorpha halys]|uniref:uncharacterized protein C19orf47 homolog isoform X2 n=1 Tax=Halyomorpha halys TaxID=286706 RepID=UPI0006D4E000|nr:uncharacterized protein C19orf47 homolog isoform X2 [Halyomorpha halys]